MVRPVAAGELVIAHWGTVPYEKALARQLELHTERLAGRVPDMLVLVSHPPTFTLGRHAPEGDVVLDRAELDRRGIEVARSDRGGRATYHGPGQVVLYPVVSIAELGLGVKDWVCLLESALIDTLADYGIRGLRHPGTAGLWTAEDTGRGQGGAKIASLGLRVSRGVSYHGVSLNTGLDASVFDCIVTCGVRGERVTTIEAATGRAPDEHEAGLVLARHIERRIDEIRERRGGLPACRVPSPKNESTKND
jgi:lipoate-protein ligase B